MEDNIERREQYQTVVHSHSNDIDSTVIEDENWLETEADWYITQLQIFAENEGTGQDTGDLTVADLDETQRHLADMGIMSPRKRTDEGVWKLNDESKKIMLGQDFRELFRKTGDDNKKQGALRDAVREYLLLSQQKYQELVGAQKVEKRSVLQGIKDKVLKTLGNIAPEKVPAIIFRTVGTLSLLTGAACQTITEAKAPVEETPVSSTIPNDLEVDETPTDVEIEVPTQTVTPEIEAATQTPEVIVTEEVTPTPTEVITPVPTEAFRRDFTEEEALSIMEEMFESENLRVIRELHEKEMVEKVYTTDLDSLYFSQILLNSKKPGIIKEHSLDIKEQNFFIKSRRVVKDSVTGNTLAMGLVGNTGFDDTFDICDKIWIPLSVSKPDSTEYDFAKESDDTALIVPMGMFFFGTLEERLATKLLFENLASKTYKAGDVVRLSEMLDYQDPGFNGIKRLEEGNWYFVSKVAGHIARVLVNNNMAVEQERVYGEGMTKTFFLEGMNLREFYNGAYGASLEVNKDGEQVGDIVLEMKEDIVIQVSIYEGSDSLLAIVSFHNGDGESEKLSSVVNLNLINSVKEIPQSDATGKIFGEPQNPFSGQY